MAICYKGLQKIFKNLLNNISIIDIIDYMNVYDVKNSQVKITPLYRVAFGSTCKGKDNFTILTDDYSIRKGPHNLCIIRTNSYKKRVGYDSWKDLSKGNIYVTIPKLNVKKFLENLSHSKEWTWEKMVDYMADGTGEIDPRIKDVLLSTVITLPLFNHKMWQALNNHTLMITNSSVGKTTCFRRITGLTPSKDYSDAGLFGTIGKEQVIIEGKLNGDGTFAFDEFPRRYDKTNDEILSSLMAYMTNGETIRTLMKEISCVGTKTLVFFGNVPKDWDVQSFHVMLTKLAGTEGVDAAGTRIGHILYGNNFLKINSTEDSEWTDKIRFVVEEMMKQKRGAIYGVLKTFKPWIESKDEEYEAYFTDLQQNVLEYSVKMFLKGFKFSWRRVKMGALKKTILENLPLFYTMSRKDLINDLRQKLFVNYERLKTYNYRSFEFLFHNKKAMTIDMIKKGMSYQEVVATGLEISRPLYDLWSWELRKDERKS